MVISAPNVGFRGATSAVQDFRAINKNISTINHQPINQSEIWGFPPGALEYMYSSGVARVLVP